MKVVYNACYGGFSLSAEARDWLIARKWAFADSLPEPYNGSVYAHDLPRHDPVLVECVEALGDRAGGQCANLAIATVDRAYEITEYDGYETVHERHVDGYSDEDVDRLVSVAVAAEREACAKEIDAKIADHRLLGNEQDESGTTVVGWRIISLRQARDAIRARSNTTT